MAAPSAPVIQNVSTAYWFGSNVRAEWVTLIDVTSCAATLTLPDGTTQSVMVNSSQIDAYTTQWVARPAPASVGRYVLSVTATNADGTSDAGTATFMVIDYPVMVISPADGSTVTGLPLDLSWVISDSTGVATQRIRITDSDGETMYSIEPPNTVRQLSLGVAELAGIEDGASYTIWLDMTNGVGLSMSAHSTVTTSWQPPVTPTATVTTDPDTLAASVTVTGDRTYTFTDVESFTAPESGLITSLTVDGKSVQDGTPTPSTPVAIECAGPYNLLSMSDRKGATSLGTKGITIVWNSDGWIDVSGTVTGSSAGLIVMWGVDTSTAIFDAGTYTLSITRDNGFVLGASVRIQVYADGAAKYIDGTGDSVTFTASTSITRIALHLGSGATGTVIEGRFRLQLERGSTAHAYQPYGSITLAAGTTRTDIDLQGHALRSLPDGTHDELTVDSAGVVTLVQRVGAITYDGSADESWGASAIGSGYRFSSNIGAPQADAPNNKTAICNRLSLLASGGTGVSGAEGFNVSSAGYFLIAINQTAPTVTDVAGLRTWLSSNPIELVYKLATEQTISLGTITPPFVASGSAVAIDAAVTPTFDATMRAVQSASTPLTDTLMVVRVSPDGTRHVLADDLESGDSVTDPLPPLGVEYAYEVTGIAATGVPSTPATVTHTNVTTCWAMNFGTGAAEVVLARFNPKASYSVEQGGELYHFADGGEGDGLPVYYPTTERDVSGADTWDTLTHATADRLNALMLRYPVGWLRDPLGHRWRAHMKPKFSHGIGKLWQVAIDWDAVRWVEA